MVATSFEFVEKIGVLLWHRWAAVRHAKAVVCAAMLPDVFIGGAIRAEVVGGQFGKEGEDDALAAHSENNDCCCHHSFPCFRCSRSSIRETRRPCHVRGRKSSDFQRDGRENAQEMRKARWERALNGRGRRSLFTLSGRLQLAQVIHDLARHDAIPRLETLHFQMLEIRTVLDRGFQNALGCSILWPEDCLGTS